MGDWVVDKESTCSEEGQQSATCTICGETVAEALSKLDHTPGDWQVVEDYSITASGNVQPGKEAVLCTACGAELDSREYTVELTMSERNAMRKASDYLDFMSFSYSGLVDQLEFEGFTHEEATFAVDHCGADWNEQAALKAQSYLDFMSFSRSGLIDQLEFEGFTPDQAEYGADSVGL
jgi:hypothetical protein